MRPSSRIPQVGNAKQNCAKVRRFSWLADRPSHYGLFRLGDQAQIDWGHFGHLPSAAPSAR